ncbi:ABC transporter ATP-binding protein [Cohnella fermenti]|uniref:ABC transporter ATP-binding protein n=1 Tax=Cohnella fermenti TaxID=2565925 RepID=A0A4S4BWN9_9BACL|nr:ABC transporter ATP-binding protein [Cohnella fermenti]THF79578.1 ABC transporter ATP-binding protein [Cohnella fermenti]
MASNESRPESRPVSRPEAGRDAGSEAKPASGADFSPPVTIGANRGHGRGGAGQKPRNFQGTLRRLWSYIDKERRWLLIVFALILVDSAVTLSTPYLIGEAVDAILGKGQVDFGYLEIVLLAMFTAYAGDAGLTLLQGWMMAGISQRILHRLRSALFVKLHRLPLAFFDTRRHGEIMSRLSNDIDNVSTSVSQTTSQLMGGVISVIGSLIFMLVLSPLLTLASLITVPLVYLLAKSVSQRSRVLFKEQQVQLGMLNGHIEETITGIDVVKAFNREDASILAFEEANAKLRETSTKAQIVSGFLMPLLGVINNLGFAAVAIVGSVLAVHGHITVGVIASFIGYSRQFVRPLNDIANVFNVLQSGLAGAERVFEVIDETEEDKDAEGAVVLTNPRGDVRFDNVTFGYRADNPILKGVSFSVPAGSSVALVGPTGAGKTTIVNLLTRFYDVNGGRILLDGRILTDYTRDSLRSCFGIVLQDTYLFSGTIADNIKIGKPEATDEEVRKAAAAANADTFIRKLPGRYDTLLTENGSNISQGQRQLIAIARVVLASPSILILDEATSSIDTRTELHIQEALLRVMEGRTTFIIAHRLSTIQGADTIMVIDKGGIAEQGSHEQLVQAEGIYAGMVRSPLTVADGA